MRCGGTGYIVTGGAPDQITETCSGCEDCDPGGIYRRSHMSETAEQLAIADLVRRVSELEETVVNLSKRNPAQDCEHEPIYLPSSRGPVPILAVQIADARKMSVITPGAEPPIAFAIAMCQKCGMPYVFINTLEEAEPFEGGGAPIPLVRPGDPVGGTGGLE